MSGSRHRPVRGHGAQRMFPQGELVPAPGTGARGLTMPWSKEVRMQAHRLHFPVPDPTPQPQPVPHPTAPPGPAPGWSLPLPMVPVAPKWTYKHLQRPLGELAQVSNGSVSRLRRTAARMP